MSVVTDERAPRTRMTYVARLTIAISATTSALLIAFAAIVWVQLSAITDRDFDRDLAATARHGFSGRPTGMMNLRQAEALFAVQADRMDLKEYFFVVQRPDTGLTFVSANWPEGFTPSSVSKSLRTPENWEDLLLGEVPETWPGRQTGLVGGRLSPRGGEGEATGTRPGPRDGLPGPQFNKAFSAGSGFTLEHAGTTYRFLECGVPGEVMVIGVVDTPLRDRKRALLAVMLPVLAAGVVCAAILGAILGRRAILPVRNMTSEFKAVSVDAIHPVVDPAAHDHEFAELISAYNSMLERLRASFERNTRFSATVAHQLKTPLTILGAQVEAALGEVEPDSEEQRVLASILEEIGHLQDLTERLLILSRAESGNLKLLYEETNISQELSGLIEDIRVTSPDLTVERDIAPGVLIQADPALLYPAILNMLVNATKYNDHRRAMKVALSTREDLAVITIWNTGAPIPPEEHERIFQHFHRATSDDAGHVAGLGLGLPVAREIARAHGGDLRLVSSDSSGTTFELTARFGAEQSKGE